MSTLLFILLGVLLLPVVVYSSIKLGTVAFYRGRQLFFEESKQEKLNGSQKSKEERS